MNRPTLARGDVYRRRNPDGSADLSVRKSALSYYASNLTDDATALVSCQASGAIVQVIYLYLEVR